MSPNELRELARLGLRAEIERLQSLLVELDEVRVTPQSEGPATSNDRPRRKRRTMTPAQRKALSARMKAMWAAKRRGA